MKYTTLSSEKDSAQGRSQDQTHLLYEMCQ
jgi:hypothetical protein